MALLYLKDLHLKRPKKPYLSRKSTFLAQLRKPTLKRQLLLLLILMRFFPPLADAMGEDSRGNAPVLATWVIRSQTCFLAATSST